MRRQRFHLPVEIWDRILSIVLRQDPSSRYVLRRVSHLFRQIVDHIPLPRLYLSPDRYRDVSKWPISVRKLAYVSGKHSGLILAVRDIIKRPCWFDAWLFLSAVNLLGWYEIKRIWYRNRKNAVC